MTTATAKLLTEIRDMLAETQATYMSQPISDGTTRGKQPCSRPPVDLTRVDLLDPANSYDGAGIITSWAQHVWREAGETGTTWPQPPAAVLEAIDWLKEHLDWCAGRGWDAAMRADIMRLHTKLRRHLRYRDPYTPHCRNCLNPVEAIAADGTVTDDWNQAAYGRCTGCGWTYPKGPALQALGKTQDYTIPEIAVQVGIHRQSMQEAIKKWQQLGLIQPTGRRGKAKLYSLARVVELRKEKMLTLHACVQARPKTFLDAHSTTVVGCIESQSIHWGE